jgi:hypothetical protein
VYRVRGAGSATSNEDTGWIAPPTQEEEEEEIRKSLARAKKKMKKNLQIQEWLKSKEERLNEKMQQEVSGRLNRQQSSLNHQEEERKAMEESGELRALALRLK